MEGHRDHLYAGAVRSMTSPQLRLQAPHHQPSMTTIAQQRGLPRDTRSCGTERSSYIPKATRVQNVRPFLCLKSHKRTQPVHAGFNVGYKRADPRHPCKKCWGKYSKAYTPALLYAPDENAVTTLQRPLPRLSPPQGAPPPPPVPPPSTRPPAGLAPPQTMQTPSGRGPGAGSQQRNRLRSHRYSLSESSSPVLGGSSRPIGSPAPGNITTVTGSPPPNAIVYPAGDPRLGGSRCWRCGGSGRVSLFILDSLQCDECGGIGRLYRDYWTG